MGKYESMYPTQYVNHQNTSGACAFKSPVTQRPWSQVPADVAETSRRSAPVDGDSENGSSDRDHASQNKAKDGKARIVPDTIKFDSFGVPFPDLASVEADMTTSNQLLYLDEVMEMVCEDIYNSVIACEVAVDRSREQRGNIFDDATRIRQQSAALQRFISNAVGFNHTKEMYASDEQVTSGERG